MTNDEKKSDRGHDAADSGYGLYLKLYEEETTETLKLPQTDIEIPEDNPWDEVPDSDTEAGH